MFGEFFAGNRYLFLPLGATLLFFIVFVAVLLRVVFHGRRGGRYDTVAALPLEEDRLAASEQAGAARGETDR